jgi:predicted anti-sigma-YlaC factor YlaD
MNCEQARETLLDSLAGSIAAEVHLLMEDHIASCEACRRFADVQRSLDARLTAAFPAVSLSPGFRSSLRMRLNDTRRPIWPESLPDIAHLAGCALAVALLLLVMPQNSRTVLLGGAGFTVVTYFLQAVLRSSLEKLEYTP